MQPHKPCSKLAGFKTAASTTNKCARIQPSMEMHHTFDPCVGPASASLGEFSPYLLTLIASFLPGEVVATGLLNVSKSLLELEEVRATVTALCFKDSRGESSDLDSVETGDWFVVPAVSATAALFVA